MGVFGTYPKQIDFFLVHGLTGNHAVRMVFPNLPEKMQRQVLKVNLLGFLTDFVVQRYPKIDVNLVTGKLINHFNWNIYRTFTQI